MAKESIFESRVCGRCAGSGRYSFNGSHSYCYGCGGVGWKHSKRGAAAYAYLLKLLSRPAGDIKVGDVIQEFVPDMQGGVVRYWAKVEAIGEKRMRGMANGVPFDLMQLDIASRGVKRFAGQVSHRICGPDAIIRVAHSIEEKAPHIAAALAYQASLNAKGQEK
jgi:hypothetical protein